MAGDRGDDLTKKSNLNCGEKCDKKPFAGTKQFDTVFSKYKICIVKKFRVAT